MSAAINSRKDSSGSTTTTVRRGRGRRALDAAKRRDDDSSKSSEKVLPASASYVLSEELPPPMRSLSPSPPPSRAPPRAPPTPNAARVPPAVVRAKEARVEKPASPPRVNETRTVGWTPPVRQESRPVAFTSPPSVTVVDEAPTTTLKIETTLPPLPSVVAPIRRVEKVAPPPRQTFRAPPSSFRQPAYQPSLKPEREEDFILRRKDGVAAPPKRHLYAQYYASLSPDEQSDMRGKFHDRFLILQRSFPEWNVPIPSEDSSLDFVHTLYDSYVRQINIHASSNYFKMFLIILFIGIEFVARAKGIDITGYAKYQISNMKRYTGVLLELGEKYATTTQSEWSAETRIVGIALIQAGVFLAAKYAERFTGSSAIGEKVRMALDTYFDSSPVSQGESTTDSVGLPIAKGTEEAVAALDDPLSSVIADATAKTQAPVFDLGGILGGLMGGKSDGLVAPLMEAAVKFLSTNGPSASPAKSPAPTSPTRTSPRSAPRKAPIYPE